MNVLKSRIEIYPCFHRERSVRHHINLFSGLFLALITGYCCVFGWKLSANTIIVLIVISATLVLLFWQLYLYMASQARASKPAVFTLLGGRLIYDWQSQQQYELLKCSRTTPWLVFFNYGDNLLKRRFRHLVFCWQMSPKDYAMLCQIIIKANRGY